MRIRGSLALLVTALVSCAFASSLAQQQAPEVSRDRLRADLDVLTSEPLAGRASLTPGAESAARFIAGELQKAGLRPANGDSYLQPFDLQPLRLNRDRAAVVVRRGGEDARFAPIAVACCCPRYWLAISATRAGTITAAASPAPSCATIITVAVGAKVMSTWATPNSATTARNTRVEPKRCTSLAPSITNPATASEYITIPVAIVFSWLQRYLIRGMALGAVK